MAGFVTRAVSGGGVVAAGGHRLELPGGGYFYAPMILSSVTRDREIARQEVFGPMLSFIVYDIFDEALSIANDTAFGLSSCLYSKRTDLVERFVAESKSGMLRVNAGSFLENHLPFVGIKDRSVGVEYQTGLRQCNFTQPNMPFTVERWSDT